MSMGTMWPGSFAANAIMPGPPDGSYRVRKMPPPPMTRLRPPRKPPPPAVCDICMFAVIQDSSPWVETSCSPG